MARDVNQLPWEQLHVFTGVAALKESDRGLRVQIEDRKVWAPKSQIHEDSEIYKFTLPPETGTLIVPEWLVDRWIEEGEF